MKNRKTMLKITVSLLLCFTAVFSGAIPAFAARIADCTEGIIPGDANSDDVANILDAITIARSVAGFSESVDKACADVNRDDAVNVLDAIIISQYILGFEGIRLCHRGEEETVLGETCLSPVTVKFDCELCEYEDERMIAAPGHNYFRGECTVCGEQGEDYGFFKTADWIKANDELADLLAEDATGGALEELLGIEALPGCYAVVLSEETDESGIYGSAEIVMYMDMIEFMGGLDAELTDEDLALMEDMTDVIIFTYTSATETDAEMFTSQVMPICFTDPEFAGVTVTYMDMDETTSVFADGVIYGNDYTEYFDAYTMDEDFNGTALSDEETVALKDKVYSMAKSLTVKLDGRYTESTGEDFAPEWLGIGYGNMTGFDGIARWIKANDQYEELIEDEELSDLFYYATEFDLQGIYAAVLEDEKNDEGKMTDRTIVVLVDAEEFMTTVKSPEDLLGNEYDLAEKGDLITVLSWDDYGIRVLEDEQGLEFNEEDIEIEIYEKSVTGESPEGIGLWYLRMAETEEIRPEWLELGFPVTAYADGKIFGSGGEGLELYVNDSMDFDLPAKNYVDQLSEEQLEMFIDDIHAGVYEAICLLGESYTDSTGIKFSPSWLGITACGGNVDVAHEFADGVCTACGEVDPAQIGDGVA